jgi:hypothetical protein
MRVTVTETELKAYRELESLFDDTDIRPVESDLSLSGMETGGIALGGGIIDIEEKPALPPGAKENQDDDQTDKKPCPSCGKKIDSFWAVCPRCKRPV